MKDVHLDCIFQMGIPTLHLRVAELCAVLMACSIARGISASMSLLQVLSCWLTAPVLPSSFLSTKLGSLVTYPPEDSHFHLLALTLPEVGSGSEDQFHLWYDVCLQSTCHLAAILHSGFQPAFRTSPGSKAFGNRNAFHP